MYCLSMAKAFFFATGFWVGVSSDPWLATLGVRLPLDAFFMAGPPMPTASSRGLLSEVFCWEAPTWDKGGLGSETLAKGLFDALWVASRARNSSVALISASRARR